MKGSSKPAAAAVLAAALASCAPRAGAAVAHIDAAARRARAFLVARQDADGAWRSRTYGALKDGASLTPPVLKALLFSSHEAGARDESDRAAVERGLAWLAAADSEADLGYPVYSASLAVIALTRSSKPELLPARDRWLALLVRHQLDLDLGWEPTDAAFGGFGYSLRPLRRDARGPDTAWDADLSSTLFALGALRVAGCADDDPHVQAARAFVERCQNWPGDGGFFMTPTDDLQNKAGGASTDAQGRRRYASYGSMTADGIRALLRCGLSRDHPRVRAARAWIEAHFDPRTNPGRFEPMREVERDAAYFYACWSTAHALAELGVDELETLQGRVDWRAALARELVARQAPDGSWRNPLTMMKEDDPLIATSFALGALELCRPSWSDPTLAHPR